MDADTMARMADDFDAFWPEIVIPSGNAGPQRLGDVAIDFQRDWLHAVGPSLVALCRGEKPPTPRFWLEATKGLGKDMLASIGVLFVLAFSHHPLHCQVGAADTDQADELRKSAKAILYHNPWLAEVIDVQSLVLVGRRRDANGRKTEHSRCEIVAADIAGSHGARPDVLILNELTHVAKREFCENLLDNASKVPNGLVIVATNAGYTGSWQESWRNLAMESDRWRYAAFKEPAPWLDEREIAEAQRRNSTTRFLRLWKGVWPSVAGDALDPEDVAACVTMAGPMAGFGADSDWGFVAGLDLGVKNDHSALVVLGANGQTQRLRLADCQSWSPGLAGQVNLMDVETAVRAAHRRFGFGGCWYDPSQALLMAQRLSKAGVPMREMPFVGHRLNEMASAVLTTFRSRTIDLYDDKQLIADLSRLTIVEKAYGHKLEAVRDEAGHADRAIALAIALPAAIEASRNFTGEIVIESLFAGGGDLWNLRGGHSPWG